MQNVQTTQIPESKHIRELTDDDVETFAREGGVRVVEVYTQWCSFCKAFAPHYEEIAKEFAGDAAFARIDADHHAEYIGRHAVQAFPTLLLYKDGALVETVIGFVPPPKLRALVRALAEDA